MRTLIFGLAMAALGAVGWNYYGDSAMELVQTAEAETLTAEQELERFEKCLGLK
jgi:hypothetical protein